MLDHISDAGTIAQALGYFLSFVVALIGAYAGFRRWFGARWDAWRARRPIALLQQGMHELKESVTSLRGLVTEEAARGAERGRQVTEMREEQAAMAKNIAVTTMAMEATLDADPNTARFTADKSGQLVTASKTYRKWTGMAIEDLVGSRWINAVAVDFRDAVRRECQSAAAECRQSVMRFEMIGADGKNFPVKATMTPIPDGCTPATFEKFVGVIVREDEA